MDKQIGRKGIYAMMTIFAVGALLVFSTQTPSAAFFPWGKDNSRYEQHYQKMFDRMARDLILTNTQRDKLQGIIKAKGEKIRKIHEEVRPKVESIHNEMDKEIRAILDPDQLERFEKMLKDREERMKTMKERMGKVMKDHPFMGR